MNVESLQFSLSSVQWIILGVVGVYSWWVGKQSATNLEVAGLRERIVAIESDMKNMPSQAAVHELNAKLERLLGNSESSKDSIEQMQLRITRIDDFLLNNK